MASAPVRDIYEACKAVVGPGDMDGLLQCATKQMELAHESTVVSMNAFLLILSGALVFFMQAGFAMLCAGSVRKKNTQNTMLKNILDACGAAIAYFTVGYAFAFGDDPESAETTFIGTKGFFGTGDIDLPTYFFQYTFAAASVTIVAGALAERCRMSAYLCYSFFLTGFVYPVAVHAVWSPNGFLSTGNADPLLNIGMVDFAGSGVVHMTGGTTALVSMYLLGSRRGRFFDLQTGELLEKPKPMPGHSVSLQMLGSFILWFGWFGFNPGSALLLGNDNPYMAHIAALAAVNTFLASAGGCVSALGFKILISKTRKGEAAFDLISAMNGTLSGLVAITAGCGTVQPWAALFIGVISGILYVWGSGLLIKLKLDDVVDAVPVHFLNGMWGVISTGLLSHPDLMLKAYGTDKYPGFFYSLARGNPSGHLLGCQVVGVLFILAWTLVLMTPFFLLLNRMEMLRSEAVEELVGLDVCYNGEDVYDKEDSAHDDAALRQEYMHAYSDFRKNRSKHGNTSRSGGAKIVIPPEPERRPERKPDPTPSSSGNNEEIDQFSNEQIYDDECSL